MPFRSTARPALALLVLGLAIYFPSYFWIKSRSLVPLDVPMSLAPGHIETGEFQINLEGNFFVYADTRNLGDWNCRYLDRVRSHSFVLSSGRKSPLTGASKDDRGDAVVGSYLGYFHATPGRYSLSVEILSPTSDFNYCNPHLEVDISTAEYYEWEALQSNLRASAAICEFVGIAMLLFYAAEQHRKRYLEAVRLRILPSDEPFVTPPAMLPESVLPVRWRLVIGFSVTLASTIGFALADKWSALDKQEAQLASFLLFTLGLSLLIAYQFSRAEQFRISKHRAASLQNQIPAWGITGLSPAVSLRRRNVPIHPATSLPAVALISALCCFVWFWPMFFIQMTRYRSRGLRVSLPRINGNSPASLDGLTAPLIFLDAKRRVFLNYQATTWDDLPAGLDRALVQLPVRVVYFDASPDIPFCDAARAIDIIEDRSAHAILLTPNSKSDRNPNWEIRNGRDVSRPTGQR
jgi:hypothetical protein